MIFSSGVNPLMRKRITTNEENPTLDMSSLTDVSFLLLIYFLVTSTLDPKESDLGMTMPTTRQGDSSPYEIDTLQIDVDANGHILINDELIDADPDSREIPLLLDRLTTYADSARLMNSEPTVIVSADDAAKGQRFVDVLNALTHKGIEINRVSIPDFAD